MALGLDSMHACRTSRANALDAVGGVIKRKMHRAEMKPGDERKVVLGRSLDVDCCQGRINERLERGGED